MSNTNQTHHQVNGQFLFIDHGNDIQQTISHYIHSTFQEQLPDLSELVILVPAPDLIYTFRKTLLNHLNTNNISAIIGAEISPLKKWIDKSITIDSESSLFINNHCRQLIILQALQDFPAHFKNENLWQVSASLLQLFDELTVNSLNPADTDEEKWIEKIQNFYGIQHNIEHLTSEAQLIYTLWQAWQQQLNDDKLLDLSSAYVSRLQSSKNDQLKNKFFIIAGAERLSANEISFIKKLPETCPVRFFIQANPEDINNPLHPDHFISNLIHALEFKATTLSSKNKNHDILNAAFQHQIPLMERKKLVDTEQNHGTKSFNIFSAFSEEHESNAVDLQVRQWLLEGKRNIAIVTENRKLARRVRALLERSGVNLVDSVGWSLSTTPAASIIERWLECIEQDFAALTFLDFLKSPFFRKDNDDNLLNTIFRFEKDIVLNENIAGNLQRYIKNLELRQNRLEHWESNCYQQINDLLIEINDISLPLVNLYKTNNNIPASQYLNALLKSLKQTNLSSSLETDEAGEIIVTEISHMQNACNVSDPKMNWFDFRTWFASALENHHYSPSSKASHVRLLNLKQSNSGYYEGLIIASTNSNHLPGPAPKTPFFNHHVRQSLGLADWQQHKSENYYLFRRLIQSADSVLVSYCEEKNNEPQQASPWLQTIIDLYQITYKEIPYAHSLYELLQSNKTSVLDSTDIELPELTQITKPIITENQIPNNFSASKHQRLINCPYQFFANDVLQLRAAEEIITELQKSEYGQKVHKILETYHLSIKKKKDLSFEQSLTELQKISKNLFEQDIEDNFLHRGWLKRWLDHCESYLRWQQQRDQEWTFHNAETDHKIALTNNIELKGRLDRIDKKGTELGIIDYKTSNKTPSQIDVETGEDIQLSSYASLLDQVIQVEYLKLDDSYGKVSSGAKLVDEELIETSEQINKRFTEIIKQIEQSTPLVSNGDDDICQFCSTSGLCRKDFWKLNNDSTNII